MPCQKWGAELISCSLQTDLNYGPVSAQLSHLISNWRRLKRWLQNSYPKEMGTILQQSSKWKKATFAIVLANLCLGAGMLTRHPDYKTKQERPVHTCQETSRKPGSSHCWMPPASTARLEPALLWPKMLHNVTDSFGQAETANITVCARVLFSQHPTALTAAAWRPSELWIFHTPETNDEKTTSKALLWESHLHQEDSAVGGGVGEVNGFPFSHICRGVEMRSRGKRNKWVTPCSFLRKKYLGSYLQRSGLWFLCGWIRMAKIKA